MKNKINQKGYSTFIFDCDSTLSSIEGIDWLASLKGKTKEIAQLTQKTMEGLIPFESVLEKRLDLILPTQNDMQLLGQEYIKNCFPQAKKIISILRQNQKEIYIISGGYLPAINIFAKWLGIKTKNVYAIDLIFNSDGTYSGVDKNNPLTKQMGKTEIIKNLNIIGPSVLIGDGATDLEAKDEVDLFIGFGGVITRSIVQQNSDIFITRLEPLLTLAKISTTIS